MIAKSIGYGFVFALGGCAVGLQNFPYWHTPSSEHRAAVYLSICMFFIVGFFYGIVDGQK